MQTKKKYNKNKSKYKFCHIIIIKCVYPFSEILVYFWGQIVSKLPGMLTFFFYFYQIWEQYFITKKNI